TFVLQSPPYLLTYSFLLSMICPPPISTLFPYTTLFRSIIIIIISWLTYRKVLFFGQRQTMLSSLPIILEKCCFKDRHPKSKREKDRKSTRLNSSHVSISYAVFCLKKKKRKYKTRKVSTR